jgi:coenzyme F420-reducing hydrogenase delta subunit
MTHPSDDRQLRLLRERLDALWLTPGHADEIAEVYTAMHARLRELGVDDASRVKQAKQARQHGTRV